MTLGNSLNSSGLEFPPQGSSAQKQAELPPPTGGSAANAADRPPEGINGTKWRPGWIPAPEPDRRREGEKRGGRKQQSVAPLGHHDPKEKRQYDQPTASFPRKLDQELGSPPAGIPGWHLPFTLRLCRHLSQQTSFSAPISGPAPTPLDWLRCFPPLPCDWVTLPPLRNQKSFMILLVYSNY